MRTALLFLSLSVASFVSAADPVPQVLLNYQKTSSSYKLNPLTGERTFQFSMVKKVSSALNSEIFTFSDDVYTNAGSSSNYTAGTSTSSDCSTVDQIPKENLADELKSQYDGYSFKGLQRGPWNSTTGGEYYYFETLQNATTSNDIITQGVFLSTKTLLPRFTWIKLDSVPDNIQVEEIFSYVPANFTVQDLEFQCQSAASKEKALFLY